MTGIIPKGRDFKEKLKSIPSDFFSYLRTGFKDTLAYLYKPVAVIATVSLNIFKEYKAIYTSSDSIANKTLMAVGISLFYGIVLPLYATFHTAKHLLIGARGLSTHLLVRPAIALFFFLLPKKDGDKIHDAYYSKEADKSWLKWFFTIAVAEKSVSDKQYEEVVKNDESVYIYYNNDFKNAVVGKENTEIDAEWITQEEEEEEFLQAFHNAIEADVIPWSNLADLREAGDAKKYIRPYNYKLNATA